MKCPFCGTTEDKVLDTRPTDESTSIRRRRECIGCGKRFTTYEVIEHQNIFIIKKNGTREQFDRVKVLNGLIRACKKRPIDIKKMEEVTEIIEQTLKSTGEKELESKVIGALIMEKLKELDIIAYVRFASVYKDFNSLDSFREELNMIIKKD